MDSQIYHWGIKENTPLGGEGGGESASRNDASSGVLPVDALGGGSPGQSPLSSGASSAVFGVDALDGAGRGQSRISSGASSATTVDENTIAQPSNAVKSGRTVEIDGVNTRGDVRNLANGKGSQETRYYTHSLEKKQSRK